MPLTSRTVPFTGVPSSAPGIYQISLVVSGYNDLGQIPLCCLYRQPDTRKIRIRKILVSTAHQGAGNGMPMRLQRITSVNANFTLISGADIPKKDTSYPDSTAEVYTGYHGADRTVTNFGTYLSLGGTTLTTTNLGGPSEIWESDEALEQITIPEGRGFELFHVLEDYSDPDDRYCITFSWAED